MAVVAVVTYAIAGVLEIKHFSYLNGHKRNPINNTQGLI